MLKFSRLFCLSFVLSLTLLKGCTVFGEIPLSEDNCKDGFPVDVSKLTIDVCSGCKLLIVPDLPKLTCLTIQNGSNLRELKFSTSNSNNHLKRIIFNNCNGLTIEPYQIPFSVPLDNLIIEHCASLNDLKGAVVEYRRNFAQVAKTLGSVRYKTKNESLVLLFSALLPEIMHCLYGHNGYQQVIANWSSLHLSEACLSNE